MKIIFKKLIINNFMSFEHAELDLNRVGYFIVRGKNNNIKDSALSNGSGKSTLFEALCWVLTGETVRGTKEVSNLKTEKSAEVELNFSVDANDYKIIRKKKPSSLFLFVNGEDKSGKGIRDTTEILNQYLPDLDSNLIGSVILLGQGLPQRFTNNSPSGRKELLEKLSKSNFMIEDLKYTVSERKKNLNDSLRKVEDKILILTTEKRNKTEEEQNISNELDNLPNVQILEEEIDSLIKDKNNFEIKLDNLNNKIKELNDLKNSLEEIKEQNQQKLLECSTNINEYAPKIETQKNNLNDLNSRLFLLSKQIKEIESISDTCPTCGQKLKGVEKLDVEPFKIEYEDLLKDKDAVENIINKLNLDLKKEYEEKIIEHEDIVRDLKEKIKETSNEITEVDIERDKIVSSNLNKLKLEIAVKEQAIQNREETYNKYNESLKSIKESLEKIDLDILYNINEKEQLEKRLTIINKINSALNKDFRGYLLINVIQYIDKIAKYYCKQVFGNNNIEFKLDGNNISILYDNKEYENLSGGEKQKIDIIVQFAIRNMLFKYLNFSSNILILDEVTDFLDSSGVESILNLINNCLKDTPAIYFITHHDNLMFPYDGEITIIKNENGISSLYNYIG